MPKKSSAPDESNLVLIEGIETRIFVVRGQKVMLDSDLAELYGVETRVLKQAVRRNLDRFPSDFMLVLSVDEATSLLASRSQSVTLKRGQNVKYAPYAFTEHGAVMLASILNSPILKTKEEFLRCFPYYQDTLNLSPETFHVSTSISRLQLFAQRMLLSWLLLSLLIALHKVRALLSWLVILLSIGFLVLGIGVFILWLSA